jgi:Universal stress protein family
MFRNILIPTDGSDLAAKAVEQGVLFAKEVGAKITAVTVTEPFHAISVKPRQLEYTPMEYKKHAETHAAKVLSTVSTAANSAGVACDVVHVERARTGLSGNHRCRRGQTVRFDRNGLARASRRFGGCPRQRDGQSAHALENSRTRVSLTAPASTGQAVTAGRGK